MKLNAIQIKEACKGKFLVEPVDTTVFAIDACIDSRQIQTGSMFVAMCGQKVDGHSFIKQAIGDGASVVVCEKQIAPDVRDFAKENQAAVIVVDNSEKALQDIASFWRTFIKGKVIGITGSTGKTTSRNILHDLLASKFKTYASPNNFNNELGLPITICNCDEDVDFLICEMGMYARGDIELLCKIARPHYGLITNIGECHIERLGSVENIAKAKSELACGVVDKYGKMFLPSLDKYRDFIIKRANLAQRGVDAVLFGDEKYDECMDNAQVWAENVELDANACASFVLCYKDNKQTETIRENCKLNIQGKHNVLNALGASAAAIACGLSLKECSNALSNITLQSGRANIVKTKYGFSIINDAYNANPQSMKASLNMFDALETDKIKILVLGDMAELGEVSNRAHSDVGKQVANLGFDKLICVGQKAQIIAQAAIDNNMEKSNVEHFDSNNEALDYLKANLDQNNLVLIKASNCMRFEYIVTNLI